MFLKLLLVLKIYNFKRFFRFFFAFLVGVFFIFDDRNKAEWLECISQALIKFAHEFDPKIIRKTVNH